MITQLTAADYASISPLLLLLAGCLILLVVESFWSETAKKVASSITLVTLLSALYATVYAPSSANPLLTRWLTDDPTGTFFTLLFLVIGIASTFLASSFFQRFEATAGEYYFLMLASIFGLILIALAADFLILFLGLETLSLSLYIWCGYMKKWKISKEAAVKYFLMGALAAAFLLYGIALIYGAIGSTNFNDLLTGYNSLDTPQEHALFMAGIALITLGLAFKAAIVPFHVWAPDVYEGAPTPVTAFMAVGTKAGAFAAFVRVFLIALPNFNPLWNELIALLAYPTLIYANLVALRQTQLRRFFAYSGISHAGFLLFPLAAGTSEALPALEYYLVIYAIATLGAFAVLAFLDKHEEGVMVRDLKGLFYQAPLLALTLSLCLLTLAGIPPLPGFFAKLYLFKLAFQTHYYGLVIVGLLTAVLSAYYYLRLIRTMLVKAKAPNETPLQTWPAAVVALFVFAALVTLSIHPLPV